jgi:hypothetical protein
MCCYWIAIRMGSRWRSPVSWESFRRPDETVLPNAENGPHCDYDRDAGSPDQAGNPPGLAGYSAQEGGDVSG